MSMSWYVNNSPAIKTPAPATTSESVVAILKDQIQRGGIILLSKEHARFVLEALSK